MRRLIGLIVPVTVIALWEALAQAGVLDADALPAPSAVLQGLSQDVQSGRYGEALQHTLIVVLQGWVAAVILGLVLGILIALVPAVHKLTSTSIEFGRAVPAVALVPVGILIFGFDKRAELLVVIFAAFWPMLVNTIAAVELVPRQLFDTASTLRLSVWNRISKVVVPAAVPRILIGARLAMATAVVLAAVAEMTGNPRGLGNEVVMAQSSVRPATAMAYVLTMGVLGYLLNALLLALSNRGPLRNMVTGGAR